MLKTDYQFHTLPVIGFLLIISVILNNSLYTSVVLSLFLSVILVVIFRLSFDRLRRAIEQFSNVDTKGTVAKVGLGDREPTTSNIGLGLEEGQFARRKIVKNLTPFAPRDLTTSINSVVCTRPTHQLKFTPANPNIDSSTSKLKLDLASRSRSRSLSRSPITQTDSRNQTIGLDKHRLSKFTRNSTTFSDKVNSPPAYSPTLLVKQDPSQQQQAMYSPRSVINIKRNAVYGSAYSSLSPSCQSNRSKRASSASRNSTTNDEYSGTGSLSFLRASPRVLSRLKNVQSPVTVRIASPDLVRSPSPLLGQLDAEVKADPRSKESVISAIRQCRKRAVHSEKDDSNSLTEVKGNETKRRRFDDDSGTSTLPSLNTSTSVCNGELSNKMDVDDSHVFTCHGIVSKTPRNAISSSISSSKASNNKKRLFEETENEEDALVVPSKKFIQPLKERKLQHTDIIEHADAEVIEQSNQATKGQRKCLSKSETESDGGQKLKRTRGRRKMPAFSAMENISFLPPSSPYEYTVKDLAETRYQAEERVKHLKQELAEDLKIEQTHEFATKSKEGASSSSVGSIETTSAPVITTVASVSGLTHLTSLIKDQSSQPNQPVASAIATKSTGLTNQLNLQGLSKPSNVKSSTIIQSSGIGSKEGLGSVSTNSVTSASSSTEQKSMTSSHLPKTSGSATDKTFSLIGTINTNIVGTPQSTAGPATSSHVSKAVTSSSYPFSSGTGNTSSQSQKSTFKPIFGDASVSKTSPVTPFTPILGSTTTQMASKPAVGGFKFNPTSDSTTSKESLTAQVPTSQFNFGAHSSASSLSSGAAGSSTAFNFGASTAVKSTNSSGISMTGASKSGFKFGASSQQSSGAFQIGQSNPNSFSSTQPVMAFGQSQSTPDFSRTTQAMTVFEQPSNSTPAFGQPNQSSFTPVASNSFGQSNQTNVFGQSNQSVPAFGQSSSQQAFGQASSSGANTGFQFNSSSTPSFGQSVGGFGQSGQTGLPSFGQAVQQGIPSFRQNETLPQGFNFAGSGTGGSVGTGGSIARDRKKLAARRKVNKRR